MPMIGTYNLRVPLILNQSQQVNRGATQHKVSYEALQELSDTPIVYIDNTERTEIDWPTSKATV
jgi:hypothetical protein